jgi:hypothetical protein
MRPNYNLNEDRFLLEVYPYKEWEMEKKRFPPNQKDLCDKIFVVGTEMRRYSPLPLLKIT